MVKTSPFPWWERNHPSYGKCHQVMVGKLINFPMMGEAKVTRNSKYSPLGQENSQNESVKFEFNHNNNGSSRHYK